MPPFLITGQNRKGLHLMGKHDREKDQDGQVPADKPIPKGDWVKKDDRGRHSGGK